MDRAIQLILRVQFDKSVQGAYDGLPFFIGHIEALFQQKIPEVAAVRQKEILGAAGNVDLRKISFARQLVNQPSGVFIRIDGGIKK